MDKQEVALVGEEIELLMEERARLLRVVGAAAMLVTHTDMASLPKSAADAVEMLSGALDALSEETLQDALDLVLVDAA